MTERFELVEHESLKVNLLGNGDHLLLDKRKITKSKKEKKWQNLENINPQNKRIMEYQNSKQRIFNNVITSAIHIKINKRILYELIP